MDNNRTLLERLGKVSAPTLARLRDTAGAGSSGLGDMALRFKVGDRVIDLATGRRGVVFGAEPRAAISTGLYTVDLTGGQRIARYQDELALDQAIAPAPEPAT